MTTVIVGVIIGLLIVAVIVIVALDRGPSTADLALAYEHAWDRLDFETIWALSSLRQRDGLDRREFARVKRAAYATTDQSTGLIAAASVADLAEAGDVAVAITALELRDGAVVHHEVQMAKRMGRWEVTGYTLRPDAPPD